MYVINSQHDLNAGFSRVTVIHITATITLLSIRTAAFAIHDAANKTTIESVNNYA